MKMIFVSLKLLASNICRSGTSWDRVYLDFNLFFFHNHMQFPLLSFCLVAVIFITYSDIISPLPLPFIFPWSDPVNSRCSNCLWHHKIIIFRRNPQVLQNRLGFLIVINSILPHTWKFSRQPRIHYQKVFWAKLQLKSFI